MKKLIFILLAIPVLLFSQRTHNLIVNGNMETGAPPSNFNYSNGAGAASGDVPTGGGLQSMEFTASANNAIAWQSFSLAAYQGKTANITWAAKSGAAGDRLRIRFKDIQSGANPYYPGFAEYVSWATNTGTFTINAAATTMEVHHKMELNGDIGLFDNTIFRVDVDTLWVDGAQADETDNDSTKTLVEAFETRGAHSNGTFLTVAGTYSESITIDASFSEWSSTGGAVTVTQVDFASKTCTVDCEIYDNIGTVLNAENVTVTTDCATVNPRGFNRLNRYNRFIGATSSAASGFSIGFDSGFE